MRPAVFPGDRSLPLLAQGFTFGRRRFDRRHADVFRTRMMGRPVTFIRGPGAARFFYEDDRFDRRGALPVSVLHSLQDEGSVQTLSGSAHRARKALFTGMMTRESMVRLAADFRLEWARSVREWERRDVVVLHRAAALALTRTACRWAGVSLAPAQAETRAAEFFAMIENAGRFGPGNWRGRAMRRRTEAWARGIVRGARSGELTAYAGTPLAAILEHRDADGTALDDTVAATELLNVLRPLVAVDRYIVFVALALHRHPSWRGRLRDGSREEVNAFVQEVRRATPYFPFVGGRAARPSTFQGVRFEPGDRVMLDLFATNRDRRLWGRPDVFDPERFLAPDAGEAEADRNALVPQGGGFAASGHRCPGEDPTVLIMAEAAVSLAGLHYRVPEQDLRVDLRRIPALPASGFVIADVDGGRAAAGGAHARHGAAEDAA